MKFKFLVLLFILISVVNLFSQDKMSYFNALLKGIEINDDFIKTEYDKLISEIENLEKNNSTEINKINELKNQLNIEVTNYFKLTKIFKDNIAKINQLTYMKAFNNAQIDNNIIELKNKISKLQTELKSFDNTNYINEKKLKSHTNLYNEYIKLNKLTEEKIDNITIIEYSKKDSKKDILKYVEIKNKYFDSYDSLNLLINDINEKIIYLKVFS